MHEGIAFCGLNCDNCPAFLATQADDMEALTRVAARWTDDTGREVRAEEILCDGCESQSGRINTFCSVCAIRECARGWGHATCAHCEEYPCEHLTGFPAFLAEGRSNLDRLRATLRRSENKP